MCRIVMRSAVLWGPRVDEVMKESILVNTTAMVPYTVHILSQWPMMLLPHSFVLARLKTTLSIKMQLQRIVFSSRTL